MDRKWLRYGGPKRCIRAFLRDQQGATLAFMAIGLFASAGMAALAVDMSYFYVLKSRLQMTADVAALAAVREVSDEDAVHTTAVAYAAKNMATNAHGNVLASADVVTGNWTSETRTFTPAGAPINAVRVVTRRSQANGNAAGTFFANIFGTNSIDITTSAIALLNENTLCLLSLDPSTSGAMSLDSDAVIDASGCTVQVNSSDPTALEANSNSSITADSICVAGDYDHGGTGTYSPAPDTGCAPMADPLADVDPPTYSGCDFTNTYLDNAVVTIYPGVYCGGLHIDGNSVVDMYPGEYIIKDADFHVDSNSSIEGDGVGIYLTNNATLHFDSNTQVSLSAPTTGDMAGMLIFQDRADSGTNSIDSNAVAQLEGTIYMPSGVLSSDSNTNITGSSAFTIIIASQMVLDSNATLTFNTDYEDSDVPLPGELASTGSLVD